MTRISAGNTLTNQYAPPFVVSNNVTTNWQLRWNATLLAFEAFDPDENVVAGGFDTIEQALFDNVTGQQVFVLPWVAASEQSLYITINGVKQHTDTFTIAASSTTTTVTMSPATGDVEFIGMQASAGATVELGPPTVGDGNPNQSITLGWLAPSEQSLLVTIEGTRQHTDAYSIAPNATLTASILTFDGTVALNDAIEIVGITTTGETPASPVETGNLEVDTGTSMGLVDDLIANRKVVTGELQTLRFKNIAAGTGITLADNTTNIQISATQLVLTQSGGGGSTLFDNNDPAAGVFKTVQAGDRIALSTTGTTPDEVLVIDYNLGDQLVIMGTDANPYVQLGTDRLIRITNVTAAYGVTLVDPSTIPIGDTITIKNQTAATDDITLTPAAGQIENKAVRGTLTGTYVINTAGGYVTLYSDGTNYYIIAEG